MSTTGVPVGRPSCSDSLGSGIRERRSSRNRTGAFLEDRSALIVEIGKKLAEHLVPNTRLGVEILAGSNDGAPSPRYQLRKSGELPASDLPSLCPGRDRVHPPR